VVDCEGGYKRVVTRRRRWEEPVQRKEEGERRKK